MWVATIAMEVQDLKDTTPPLMAECMAELLMASLGQSQPVSSRFHGVESLSIKAVSCSLGLAPP